MRMAILLLLAPLTLAAQEVRDSVTEAEAEIRTERLSKFFAQGYKGRGRIGAWGHAQAREEYLSFVGGGTVRMRKFYLLGLAAGIETEAVSSGSILHGRAAGIFIFDNSRVHLSFYNEVGKSRDWYRAELLGLHNTAGVGFVAEAENGVGLHVRSLVKITERGRLGASGSYFLLGASKPVAFLGIHFMLSDRRATTP